MGTQRHPCPERTTNNSVHKTMDNDKETYMILFLVKHKRCDSPTSVSAGPSLTTDMNGSAAPAVLVLSTRDGASRHWHDEVSRRKRANGDNRSG